MREGSSARTEPDGSDPTDDSPAREEETGGSSDTAGKETAGPSSVGRATSSRPTAVPPADDEFGWRGWVLVGTVILSILVIPWTIILLRRAQGLLTSLGLGLRDAYLVLPLVPAIGLAVVAVWAAVAGRRDPS